MTGIKLKLAALIFASIIWFPMLARAEWVYQESHAPRVTFRGVQAVSSNVVWVSGTHGTCRRTVDGGKTWENADVPDAVKLDFRGLFAFDDRTAVLISSGEAADGLTRIYRTEDAGQIWHLTFKTSERGVFLDGVSFWNRSNGIAVGDQLDGKWHLLTTKDGGRNWNRIPPAGLPPMLPGEGAFAAGNTSIGLSGAETIWLASGAAERARIFISTNRAQTWDVHETPMPGGETAGIYGLRILDARRAIAVGGDYKSAETPENNVIVTEDGGRTWRFGGRTNPAGLKETVVALPHDELLAIGPSGTSRSRDFGKTWLKVDDIVLHAASCFGGACWAVGNDGAIGKWKEP